MRLLRTGPGNMFIQGMSGPGFAAEVFVIGDSCGSEIAFRTSAKAQTLFTSGDYAGEEYTAWTIPLFISRLCMHTTAAARGSVDRGGARMTRPRFANLCKLTGHSIGSWRL